MSQAFPLQLLEAVICVAVLAWVMRQAAGKLAPKVAIGALLFLVTRKPVIAVAALGAAGCGYVLSTTHAPGRDSMPPLAVLGFSAFLGLGVAALVVGPGFMIVRAFHPKTEFPLEPGETLLSSKLGNHFLGGESRGGRVLVTTRRLGFCPNRFNVQLDTWSVPLAGIRAMRAEGLRFLVLDTDRDAVPVWIVTASPAELAERLRALAARPEAERASS